MLFNTREKKSIYCQTSQIFVKIYKAGVYFEELVKG